MKGRPTEHRRALHQFSLRPCNKHSRHPERSRACARASRRMEAGSALVAALRDGRASHGLLRVTLSLFRQSVGRNRQHPRIARRGTEFRRTSNRDQRDRRTLVSDDPRSYNLRPVWTTRQHRLVGSVRSIANSSARHGTTSQRTPRPLIGA